MEVTIEPLDDSRFPRETSCFQPLQPVRVVIAGARRALAAAVTVSDGAGVVYAARNVALDGGSGEFAFRVRGVLGVHTVKALPGGSVEPMAMHRFGVRAETRVCTGDATFDALVPRLKAFVLDNVGALFVGRDCVKGCRPQSGDWSVAIRDHAYQLKALRYWEADVKSAVEHFCKRQLPDGSIYECVGRGDRRRLYERDRHSRMHYDEQHDAFYYRDALQADVEHLGVEAAYIDRPGNPDQLWQFLDVDFARIAEAIGCFGVRVERAGELRSALEEALASGKPAIVDVVSD
ncbi:MAG: thiamine pyrophosphate-dependent enzyme, partial [Armatimonadota bacterium]